jgi:hypothetical protein
MWKKLITWIALGRYSKLSRFVYAQQRHETGDFKSPVFRRYKNPFGMKTAINREQLGRPGPLLPVDKEGKPQGSYQQYRSYYQSVRDFKLWLEYNRFPEFVLTPFNYVRELKKRKYFEDTESNYLNGIKSFL